MKGKRDAKEKSHLETREPGAQRLGDYKVDLLTEEESVLMRWARGSGDTAAEATGQTVL